MSPEALRAGLYALGATLVGVAEFDDTLIAAGIQADYIPDAIAKILLAVGVFAIGWAKTNRFVGDFKLADVSDALRASIAPATVPAAEAKAQTLASRVTDPGMGPASK